ncbi:MAG: malate dehydrogenase (oxaloacetate-decarboxylating)(NADP+), partial [Rhodospirillaceae bacterium]
MLPVVPARSRLFLPNRCIPSANLTLAYSPGVAGPCRAIHQNPALAYDYTSKGNLVAVISSSTAVLGLSDLSALTGKPIMEGKAVLFKRFADVDAIDLEIETRLRALMDNPVSHDDQHDTAIIATAGLLTLNACHLT